MKRPIAIDLFAGCGGMSLGLEAAGFDVAVAVEIDPIHSLIHHHNFPYGTTICKDISAVQGREIFQALDDGGFGEHIDLLVGGPPCQGFSLIGKREVADPRNSLVFEYLRIVRETRPKHFIFENVPGMTTGKHKAFLSDLIKQFEAMGYVIRHPVKVLDATTFGAPQKRKRLILMGSRADQPLIDYPQPTHMILESGEYDLFALPLGKTLTVGEAIGSLSSLDVFTGEDEGICFKNVEYSTNDHLYHYRGSDFYEFCHQRFGVDKLWGHVGSVHTETSIERFKSTACGQVESVSRFIKLHPEGYCNTLRAGTNSDKGAYTAPRPIHYEIPRCISIREAARLHSYPDWFQFHRKVWHGFRQIGNSVIPMMAKALGGAALDVLEIRKRDLTDRYILQEQDTALLSYNMTQASSYWQVDRAIIPTRKRLNAA
jgi:DNA (cytosine-5)-methyltransferase 1